ncbi:hypothetical protein [Streptomyces sp. NPDC127066]|uniref:hypothetical protein n=1 Tax=Streptomyces sp. NPDC127066 TaxID=3347125 RepID=UPI00364EEDAA
MTTELADGTFLKRELGKQKFKVIAERQQKAAVHRERTEANVERALRLTNPRKPVWRHARLLYTSQTGRAIRCGSGAKLWTRNVKRANAHLMTSGVKVRVPEDTTLHDPRHSYASVLIKNGATPKQAQMRPGHAEPSIRPNVPAHLREAEEDRTASMMEAALRAKPDRRQTARNGAVRS